MNHALVLAMLCSCVQGLPSESVYCLEGDNHRGDCVDWTPARFLYVAEEDVYDEQTGWTWHHACMRVYSDAGELPCRPVIGALTYYTDSEPDEFRVVLQ